jgi:hypothetical protein
MQVLNLSPIANQEFTTYQDGNQYDIAIQETNGCMSATISVNGTQILSGQRITAGCPLIPFQYLQGQAGNFCFLCSSDDIIYYTNFGTLQQLLYLSYAETQALA